MKLQPAVDFISAYGMAILVVIVALLAISAIALRTPKAPSCISPPGFNCDYISINSAGVLTAKFSQAIGSQITIDGAACDAQQNYTYDSPLYGNVGVGANSIYYPAPLSAQGHYPPGNTIYSDSSYVLYVPCYGVSGQQASGALGSQFTGYLWLNYSISGYGSQIQKIATFTAEYS